MGTSYLFQSETEATHIYESLLKYGVNVKRFCGTLTFQDKWDVNYFEYHYLCKMLPDRRPKKL